MCVLAGKAAKVTIVEGPHFATSDDDCVPCSEHVTDSILPATSCASVDMSTSELQPGAGIWENVLHLQAPAIATTVGIIFHATCTDNQWRNYRPCRPCNAGSPRTQGAQSGCPKIFSDSALYCSVRHCSFKFL